MGDDEDRRRLRNIAYRLLGSVDDAEDVVQETYLRWHRLDDQSRREIRSPRAWMTQVATRICYDHLGSARVRRESYVGSWLPDPVPSEPPAQVVDPADRVTLDESVRMALLVLLETMTPAERVALVLHDVFGMPYAEIARTVGRTPQACRQLASSARKRIKAARTAATSRDEHERIVAAFVRACADGNLDALAAVLAPDVVATTDSGGKVPSARRPVAGAARVAQLMLGIATLHRSATFEVTTVNGLPGIVAYEDGRVVAVSGVDVAGGLVTQLWIVTNPDKLTHWQAG
ncbi:RNA polymerase sigma factor SigJ [Pseudonocardia acaciae]|uniref:RNA polymerase sigma factor SigJ n=1 Tax=Pseudonocardia acaciae TaxID=551276 RepID=UPI0005607117|nr:RNA polymerase sigma factor SigJ [Pseudonocardia acaciae]